MSQAYGAFDHVVVGVVVDIAQETEAEQQVHDEHEDDEVVGVGGGVGQMAKALAHLVFEAQEGEQVLEEDEAGEGGAELGVELEGEGHGHFTLAERRSKVDQITQIGTLTASYALQEQYQSA